MTRRHDDIGAVVIGRNEGDRLLRCLSSLTGQVSRVVYVDSGSTDGSIEAARERNAEVVVLDTRTPFTAALARNAGLDRLAEHDAPDYVQFIDGDCELQPDWVETARNHLIAHPRCAVVCGRRRERFPDASVYNRLIDREWDTPVGIARSCGGDSFMRFEVVRKAGGYRSTLIAGEEPELCVRIRQAGWEVHRIDAEMTLHDAAITRFSQWWKRSKRAGHAYAEGALLHGRAPERHYVPQLRRALIWGVGIPTIAVLAIPAAGPAAFVVLLAWPLQILRLGLRSGDWTQATFLTLGKLPEALGALSFGWARLTGTRRSLIEYK